MRLGPRAPDGVVRMHPRSLVVLAVAICPQLPCQTPALVAPAAALAGSQGGSSALPFSLGAAVYQQLHDKSTFSHLTPTVLTQMRMRFAGSLGGAAGVSVDFELWLGTALDAAAASATFASNVVASTEVNAMRRKNVLLPSAAGSWTVGPFLFDVPFGWSGSNLSWRAVVYGNSTNQTFQYPLDLLTDGGASSSVGGGCGTTPVARLTSTIG